MGGPGGEALRKLKHFSNTEIELSIENLHEISKKSLIIKSKF